MRDGADESTHSIAGERGIVQISYEDLTFPEGMDKSIKICYNTHVNRKYIVSVSIALGMAIFPLFASARSFSVHTSNATNITATSAVLEAYATGFDGDARIGFEWGQDNLDNDTPHETTTVVGEKIRIRISGLSPSTRYTFRAHGSANDYDDEGITLSFTTRGAGSHAEEITDLYANSAHKSTLTLPVQFPRVTTLAPSVVCGNSATFRGYADTFSDDDTRYWFQYGIRGSELVPTRAGIFQSTTQSFSSDVWSLRPDTEYEVRAVAENALGITVGEIVRFRTAGSAVWRAEPYVYENIAVTNGVLDITNPENPIMNATVWTAGSPVRVKVEYGSTRAVTKETAYTYVAQTGGVVIALPAIFAGRTLYYRVYAEDGKEYVRGDLVSVQIPKVGFSHNVSTGAKSGGANLSKTSFWQRFIASLSGKKVSTTGVARDVSRENVLALSLTVLHNGRAVTSDTLVPKKNDVLGFSFELTDTVAESAGVFNFVLPEGCTYLSSDGVQYDRANRSVSGQYIFRSGTPLVVRCIVDDVATTKQVLGTFAIDAVRVTSNEVMVGKSGFSVGALALGAFSFGTSTLVTIFVVTFLLAIGIVRLHDRTLGKHA